MMASFVKCDFGDWVGMAVIAGIGLFSMTFLGLSIAVLAKYLFWNGLHGRRGAP